MNGQGQSANRTLNIVGAYIQYEFSTLMNVIGYSENYYFAFCAVVNWQVKRGERNDLN